MSPDIKGIQMYLCKRARRMRAGVSLFKVYVLGNGAFIREAVVTSRVKAAVYLSWPESNIRIGLAVDVKINFAGVCLKDVWFLSDMNVQDGGYNQHRLFFKRTAAQRFMEQINHK